MKQSARTKLLWVVALSSIAIGVVGTAIPHGAESLERSQRAELYRLSAAQRLARGDPAEATRATLEALALDPQDSASWELLGDLRQRQERWAEARAAYEQANSLDGHRFRPWLQLGRVHRALGLQEEAQAAIAKARELDPDHSGAAIVAAEIAEDRGELQRARDLYAAVGSKVRGVTRARVLTKLAALHERDGDREAAALALRTAAAADGKSAERWGRAARGLERAGAVDAALEAMEREAALLDEPAAWERIGRSHAALGASERAFTAYQAANAGGDRPAAWAGIGRLRLEADDAVGARAAAERAFAARRHDPRPEAAIALGSLLVDLGRSSDATRVLEPIVAREGDAGVVDMLARAQAGAGQERKAATTCGRLRLQEDGEGPGPFCLALLTGKRG